jgi:hypothetical protein
VIRFAGALAATALLAAAPPAWADEERLTVNLRGAAFIRSDDGYAEHAEVFGLGGADLGGGGVVEGGVRVLPRLWLYASWSGFTSLSERRLGQLRVTNQVLLAQVGLTALRRDLDISSERFAIRIDLLAGAGMYSLSDDLEGVARSDRGPGGRVGGQVTFSWRSLGFIIAYGFHLSSASLDDRVGGSLRAGGNEVGGGLALRF